MGSDEQLLNISGIADVIYVLLTANYIGRRYALSIAHLFIGVSCVSMAFIPKEYSNTILVLYLLATVFAGASKYIRGFTKFCIKVLWRLQFLECLRTLCLKFRKARTKIEVVLSLPCWLSQLSCPPLSFHQPTYGF